MKVGELLKEDSHNWRNAFWTPETLRAGSGGASPSGLNGEIGTLLSSAAVDLSVSD